ncbi:MAG: hypothetical protein AB7W16_00540 [Candidatus Obscuribacterales bacterium]
MFAILALVILCLKPQHYVSMSRFQHYGIAFAIFGLGYLLETALSWKTLHKWARGSYLGTGLLFGSAGLIFWFCPWLDVNLSVQTAETDMYRTILLVSYLTFSVGVGAAWARWIVIDSKKIEDSQTQQSAGEN